MRTLFIRGDRTFGWRRTAGPGPSMLFVKCKNPECGGEIKAPFPIQVRSAFSRMVSAEISCPYCRVSTSYSGSDFHQRLPKTPAPLPVRASGPSGPSGPSDGGAMPR
jgi:hypothetical protein